MPYYLITNDYRLRALERGAIIQPWTNPQLSLTIKPIYGKEITQEIQSQTLTYQAEAQGGTMSLSLSEEDILSITPRVSDAQLPVRATTDLHQASNGDTPQEGQGSVPL